jgi:putative transposase
LVRERIEAWQGRPIEASGEADHVNLLFPLPSKQALSDFVSALKTGTSRNLRSVSTDELSGVYRKPALWRRSYCVISVGGAPLSVL